MLLPPRWPAQAERRRRRDRDLRGRDGSASPTAADEVDGHSVRVLPLDGDDRSPPDRSRLDGWANRDLNVGAMSLRRPTCRRWPTCWASSGDRATVLNAWGPEFDAELCWTARGSAPTARRPPRSSRRPSAWPESTSTPGPAGARSRTGTPSSRSWRCTASAASSTRVSMTDQVAARITSDTWSSTSLRSRSSLTLSEAAHRSDAPGGELRHAPPTAATSCSPARRSA